MTGEISLEVILRSAEIIAILGGGAMVAFRVGRTASRMEEVMKFQSVEISELKEETKKLGTILTTIAVQESRMERIEKDIFDLRRGKGWVSPIEVS